MTHRTSSSFLSMLVIWVMAVFVVPRAAVLLAGRAVDVPSVDELSAKKQAFGTQMWASSRQDMANWSFKDNGGDPQATMKEFQDKMEKAADERDKKSQALTAQLNEDRANRQRVQQGWAFAAARLSPLASFSLAVTSLAGTDLKLSDRFIDEAGAYQDEYAKFMKAKTGMVPGRGMIVMRVEDSDREKPKPVDPKELPEYTHRSIDTQTSLAAAVPGIGLLFIWGLGAFAAAFWAFLRYDLR